jgi:hypothetical protein
MAFCMSTMIRAAPLNFDTIILAGRPGLQYIAPKRRSAALWRLECGQDLKEGLASRKASFGFRSSHRCLDGCWRAGGLTPTLIYGQAISSLPEVCDADVAAAGFIVSVAYPSGNMDVSSLR